MENDTVLQFTNKNLKFVEPTTSTLEIFNLMQKNKIHHLPVIESGVAIGIISDRDVSFVNKAGNSLELVAKDIMTEKPITVDENVTIPHAVNLMRQKKINSVLIQDKSKKITGIFTTSDALDVLASQYL